MEIQAFATLVIPFIIVVYLAALLFIWVEGTLPGVIFAQLMARGIGPQRCRVQRG